MDKKIFLAILLAALGVFARAADISLFAGHEKQFQILQGQLKETLQQQISDCPIYETTRVKLEAFYNREDFKDKGKKTGWYRVDDFLKWLQKNETSVKERLAGEGNALSVVCGEINAKGGEYPFLAVYLGFFYTADKFIPIAQQKNIPSVMHTFHAVTGRPLGSDRSFIGINTNDYFVGNLNSAIHETAHLLPDIRGDNYLLSETASVYIQQNHALPEDERNHFHFGARNPFYALTLTKGIFGRELLYHQEYSGALFAIALRPYIKKNGVFKLAGNDNRTLSDRGEMLLGELLFNIILFHRGYIEAPFTTELLAKRFTTDKDTQKQIELFLNIFAAALDKKVDHDQILRDNNLCGADKCLFMIHDTELKARGGDEKVFKEFYDKSRIAILEFLQSNYSPPPRVPRGYR